MSKTMQYILIIIILFISNDTLTFGTSGNTTLGLIHQIIYAILIIFLSFSFQISQQPKIPKLLLATLLFIIFLTSILNLDFSLGYLIQINSLILGYLIAKNIKFESFALYFNKVLFFISLTSIFLFFVFILFPVSIGLFNVQENIAGVPYINLYFYTHFVSVFRNTGIYREPGVYMIYLNLGIIFELFIKNSINKKYIVVFILALLTTLSTAGFIIASFIGLSFLLKEKKFKTFIKTSTFILILSIIIFYNYDLFETSLMKFDKSTIEYGSTVARMASITVPFSIFLDNPFLGVGLANYNDLFELYSRNLLGFSLRADGHSTNTFFNSLATYGLVYFLILFISFYKLSKLFSSSFIFRVMIFISFLFMLSNEDLRYSLLFSVLLFYGVFGSQHKPILKK
ncbi:MAG: O-antigen ligase family protein [Lutibacter sp.]|nr:O-antigen ligase family protein [Lutibacter sp.]